MSVSFDLVARLPKVALHDHLDGGLRPATVIELAAEVGHDLPATDPARLADWFFDAADSGSLERYLSTFSHTIAVMQTAEQLRRVAREFVLDQAADGVVYAEARWAPEQHLRAGLTPAQAVEAVRDGLAEGMAEAAAAGRAIVAQQVVTAMRHAAPRRDIAELAVTYRNDSVCGFDLAGSEAPFPPALHAETFEFLRSELVPLTIHAGEAAGLESIAAAVASGAVRLGHGVRIIDDVAREGEAYVLGPVASYVRDRRIALEVCPTSNIQTGICDSVATHPVGTLLDAGFVVTISCDNRLMSRTSLSRELAEVASAFGLGVADLQRIARDSMRSAFYAHDQREWLLAEVIEPAYEDALSG